MTSYAQTTQLADHLGSKLLGFDNTNVYDKLKGLPVSVMEYGAVGDGVTNDAPAIQAAINAAFAAGGGTVYFPDPVSLYQVSAPIEIKSGVDIVGATQNVRVRKTNAAVSRATTVAEDPAQTHGLIDCVFYGFGPQNFSITNIVAYGNRVTTGDQIAGTDVSTATSFGFYLYGATRFQISNTRAEQCLQGYKLLACYIGGITVAEGRQCSGFPFYLGESCTSLTFNSCGSYASGGAWSINSCVYLTLNSPWCDLSDRGGLPFGAGSDMTKDPFGDAGGSYNSPAYVFYIAGSHGIAINAPGMEGCYSNWLYAEGSEITVNNPYIYQLVANNATWRLIQLRGTTPSTVTINAPYGFSNVVRTLADRAIYIEDSTKQRLFIKGKMRVDAFTTSTDYSAQGIIHADAIKLVNYSQANMIVGADTTIQKSNAGDTATVTYSSGLKRLTLKAIGAGSTRRYHIPLPKIAQNGMFCIRMDVIMTAATDLAHITVADYDGTGTFLSTLWTAYAGAGLTVSLGEWKYLSTTNQLAVDIVLGDANEQYEITNLELLYVACQT